ncbi:hypothetical protein B1748_05215 [Paenibacillus sp. MY03]|uniref:hypothetical protein n=1 Tax=Paenibacillus sp. MY03 TaxID=302980 RepID=UPI000B3CEBAC|nr:hypothetical protein [Paenibacillus sp. MY03]OUS78159.1 hypothetical protein B1748_05215 [Paenibacillus sp. MY03]
MNEANQFIVSQTESRIEGIKQLTASSVTDALERSWSHRYEDFIDFRDLRFTQTGIKSDDVRSEMRLYSLVAGWSMNAAGFRKCRLHINLGCNTVPCLP